VTASTVSQELQSGQLPSTTSYDPATSEVFLNTSYTGPLTGSDLSSVPFQLRAAVDRIEMQSSFAETDVAIVHVSMNDMPSVQLGDSSTVQQQDQLTIIGFPGNGDVSQQPTDLLTASVNIINVSSIKTTDSGAEVIQVGGNVERGDSGGPGLDSNGSVVGIVSFGLSSSNSPGGTSFLQASNSARTLVQSLKLDTSPGPFQKAWSQAFTDYSANTAGHWHKAVQEFTSIAAKYPLFKAITPYLNYAQLQARNEQVSTTPSTGSSSSNAIVVYAWTFGGIVLLVLLIVAMFRVVMWRRKRRSVSVATASSGIIGAPQVSMSSSRQIPSPSGVSVQQGQQAPAVPGIPAQQKPAIPADDDGMTAFGAPPGRTLPSPIKPYPTLTQVPAVPPPTSTSGTLRTWPCGHLNRSNARYCSICGEPASAQTIIRRVEP
jgi:Trypsin-like peptidase domain